MNFLLQTPLEIRLALLFIVGACVGRLVNRGIYRLAYEPRAIGPWPSGATKASTAAPLRRWSDRIPISGWYGMRRETKLHGAGFWVRPLIIELLTGALFAGLYWWEIHCRGLLPPEFVSFLNQPGNAGLRHDALITLHWEFLAHAILASFMLVATFIDLDEKTIPDAVTIPGTLLGLGLVTFAPRALLPIVNLVSIPGDGLGFFEARLDTLTFSAPNPWPWPSELLGQPGSWSLMLGLGCVWLWCLGLMPRVWRLRRGWRVACGLFWGRLTRDRFTGWIIALGLMMSIVTVVVWRGWTATHWPGLSSALFGMAVGGGMVWIVRIVGTVILGREAMGFGDVTLMAMFGALLGWQACLVIFFLATFGGAAVGIAQLLLRRDPEIRFGPFLCLAALMTIVRWQAVWESTIGLFGAGWLVPAVLGIGLTAMVPLLVLVRAIGAFFRKPPKAEKV